MEKDMICGRFMSDTLSETSEEVLLCHTSNALYGEAGGKPIKVLHYIKHLGSGGGEAFLYNIYQNIDRSRVQFDFLVNTSKQELLDDKITALGGRKVILLNEEPKSTFLKIVCVVNNLYRLLKKEEYKIIHIHCSNGQGLLYAWIAKVAGVPVRITHIHNVTVEGKAVVLKKMFHDLCKLLFMNAPTDYFACSRAAAKWLYSDKIIDKKQYVVINNGIDPEKFRFDEMIRKKIRGEFNFGRGRSDIVSGEQKKKILLNIGRMEEQKNQIFLLDIFDHICNLNDDYRLVLIGRGSLEKAIKKHMQELDLADKMTFIKYTDHVEEYMWASDLFLLPSNSEGLGIVAIEAQAAGLRTIVSDRVPREAFITDLISATPLDASVKEWAENVIKADLPSNDKRKRYPDVVKGRGFEIAGVASQLQNFYEDVLKNRCRRSI